jgi:UDP-glucose 4-epimerase
LNTAEIVLVTGGLGYVGSHASIELMRAGYEVIILDNLANSSQQVLERITRVAGKRPMFMRGDIRDERMLDKIFSSCPISAVVHQAGLKITGHPIIHPLNYYENNVHGSVCLLQAMTRHEVKTLVFSSSANVYGDTPARPVSEDFPLAPLHSYGWSKLMVEQMLNDLAVADTRWRIAILRYFNPVGAHESGMIGDDPYDIPTNLMPYISRVAFGRMKTLPIFGKDYPTNDGTGVRDYIHVVDLAEAHVAALDKLTSFHGALTVNLGTGRSYSVLELVRAFERASGKTVPIRFVERRAGGVASRFADVSLAQSLLNWRPERDLKAICDDTWHWQCKNPMGYNSSFSF